MTSPSPAFVHGRAELYEADCIEWLSSRAPRSIHGVVTDPPYGLLEYTKREMTKKRNGRGGVWRVPPSFDGHQRAALPRFTVLSGQDLMSLYKFFRQWAEALLPVLVPGAHVLIATNPLVSHVLSMAIHKAGFERRGEIVRLVMTMRGGDRPKNAHDEFPDVTVMPRSQHEPWVLFRAPMEGRVQDNLRRWKTGGLRRPEPGRPFGDVITSHPARRAERALATHPSLKPQSFLRHVVRAILPMGEGVVLDPFAGSGSTLAACEAVRLDEGRPSHDGYLGLGVELDPEYVAMARESIPALAAYQPPVRGQLAFAGD